MMQRFIEKNQVKGQLLLTLVMGLTILLLQAHSSQKDASASKAQIIADVNRDGTEFILKKIRYT